MFTGSLSHYTAWLYPLKRLDRTYTPLSRRSANPLKRRGLNARTKSGTSWVNDLPQVLLSSLVQSLKGISSSRLRRVQPKISNPSHQGVLWSPSYFVAACGGAALNIIRQYIENQRANQNRR